MSKTVSLNGTFEIKNAAATVEARAVTKSEVQHEEATHHLPFKLLPTVETQISMGGVEQAKKMFLRVDNAVTLKFNQNTDVGFSFGPGDFWYEGTTGITGVWITTGPNVTQLEAIFAGE